MNDGSITSTKNIIQFQGIIRPALLRHFYQAISNYLVAKPESVVLDFANCTDAYPNVILPIISQIYRLREMQYIVYAVLPKNINIKKRFMSSNWAHYLQPMGYPQADTHADPHLTMHHYKDFDGHSKLTNLIQERLLETIHMPRQSLGAIGWIINELMDNVINHSASDSGGLAQLSVFHKHIDFCVADCGMGILSSLREGYPNLRSEKIAIEEAVKAGVTRNKAHGMGNGMSGSLLLAIRTGGWFRVLSGTAELLWKSQDPEYIHYSDNEQYFGTMVNVQLPYNDPIDLSRILADATHLPYYVHLDYSDSYWIETQYTSSDGKSMHLNMRKETSIGGFGSRTTGRHLMQKALNLLTANADIPLVIDWEGVIVIASSYADEFVGKLFVTIGPTTFMRRVKLIRMSPEVQSIIDRAILQRSGAVG